MGGGQFWTPITRDRGSIFYADQHVEAGIAQEALHEVPQVRVLNRVRDIAAEIHTIFAKCSPRS